MYNINQYNCCGCGACVETCPVKCIDLSQTKEGFYRAKANEDNCIGCGICMKNCPLQLKIIGRKTITAYAAYAENKEIRCASSSGGVFRLLAQRIIEHDGVVFGAAFDDDMNLAHICAKNMEQLSILQGSKYLQSNMKGVYSHVRHALELDRKVMFVGTPCQVSGLYSVLGNTYNNLLTCDLVCHGVPSPGLFSGYISYLENKYNGRIVHYNFRSKDCPNDRMSYTVKITVQRNSGLKDYYLDGDEEPYTMRFISGALQAECCYECPYASQYRTGDITLADYWGYERVHPELYDVMGVSLVLVNTQKGEDAIKPLEGIILLETCEAKYLQYNTHLTKPALKHADRDALYRGFSTEGFSKRFYKKSFLPEGYGTFILKRRVRGVLG